MPIFKVFCCLSAKVFNFVIVLAKRAGLLYVTLASSFKERSLLMSLRNHGKLVPLAVALFSICFFF